ncbi:MAG: hypothetical protein A2Y00_09520 [Omnitrophica WOR_2 bacterium GWF2_43_52]|nr:MAG: hypothetical protein A2062_03060 [Omnitrophica WOR_2 bacterium GWA2_44_7]OGX21472.1 MAG: hypothetical protein A2Y00_09520 [Omnitrophica WOR_2 bacterium GWF2_43_52]HAH20890.1 hypothetical protein [Candidatus Omnitrophota bacterium]HBG63724.1 hypothetical protein [Candidatus Omnitrophota bacterium]HCD38078.1 hypothetical protein [Candidatus Omnitrophota bacterium]
MSAMTKGQVEAQVSEAIIKFEKDYMGRGPTETRTYIIKDMVLVRLKGVLTPAEEQLAKTAEGADLIKKTRVSLLDAARHLLENIVVNITGCQVRSLHTDISTRTGERVIIFILEQDLEIRFKD